MPRRAALLAALRCSRARERPRRAPAGRARLPDPAARQRLERAGRPPAGARPSSDVLTASIGLDAGLHPDFSAAGRYGIPINVVRRSTPRRAVRFAVRQRVGPGALPDPRAAPDRGRLGPPPADARPRRLPALRAVRGPARRRRAPGAPARAPSSTCARTACGRPAGRAPTPPGCRSCPASRATTRSRAAASTTRCASRPRRPRRAYVYPARHAASDSSDPALPPMGLRVRLRRGGLPGGPRPAGAGRRDSR